MSKKLQDGDLSFLPGMNSLLAPDQLPPGYYPRAVNMVNRGGILQCRPGYGCLDVFPDGVLQGGCWFEPRVGSPALVFAVSGVIYVSEYPYNSHREITGATFSPTAQNLFFEQVEQSVRLNSDTSQTLIAPKRWIVIQDGAESAPALFDGTRLTRQTGRYKIPPGGVMKWVGDRLWVARGAKLYPSDIGNPLSFYEHVAVATVRVFTLPGDITAMAKTPSATMPQLFVFTSTNTTLIQAGVSRALWNSTPNMAQDVFPNIGATSHLGVTQHNGFLWWHAQHGLTSLDVSSLANVTSALPYADAEMADSKSRLSSDLSGVALGSYENYLLVSVPYADMQNTHTWVLDSTSLLAGKTAPVWNSVWTGTRPKQWLPMKVHGVARALYLSVDYDGKNRLWEAFTPDRMDNGCPITWWAEMRGYTFGSPGKLKKFRYADIFLSELSGRVDVGAFWAGAARGRYKRVAAEIINATEGSIRTGTNITADSHIFEFKKQSRAIRTQDALELYKNETLTSEKVEHPDTDTQDESFQLLVVGTGPAAIRAVVMYAEPPTNVDDSGGSGLNDADFNAVRFDGAAAEGDTFQDPLDKLQVELPLFTSVRTATVESDGFIEIAMAESESVISQAHADYVAEKTATRKASEILQTTMPRIVSMGEAANESL